MSGLVKSSSGGSAVGSIDSFRHAGIAPFERWYPGNLATAGTNADAPVTANSIRASPFASGRGGMVDRIGVRQNAAGSGGGLIRLGIYASTSKTNLYPDLLVADSGDIAADGANGAKTVAISSTLLADTLYWLVFLPNGSASAGFRTHHALVANQFGVLGMQNDFAFDQPASGYSVAFAYAALPATFPVGATLLRNTNIPMVFLRLA